MHADIYVCVGGVGGGGGVGFCDNGKIYEADLFNSLVLVCKWIDCTEHK